MNGLFQAVLKSAARNGATEITSARKKQGKKCRQNEQQRCSADAAACRSQVFAACDGNAECIAGATPCCETCSADGLLTCLILQIASRDAIVNLG